MAEIVFQNPHAIEKMHLQIDFVCNTPEEKILSNVIENSKPQRQWIKWEEANNRTALICGSGPSLAEDLEDIRSRQLQGEEIFALNGAAGYLNAHGIIPDYQVIMDAQERTKEIVSSAARHLFASQVDPELFRMKPDAILWQSTYGNNFVDEQEGFPKPEKDYCLIGSSWSIGGTAFPLVYAMGYRAFHIYGLDSSNKGVADHVTEQKINNDDIYSIVEFGGKDYISSLTMKMQAQGFISRIKPLLKQGCNITMHGKGLLPDMWNAPPLSEEEKYKLMWTHDAYRHGAPGEMIAGEFLEIVKPHGLVIDFGCGTGRGAIKIKEAGCDIQLIDFVANSRDPAAMTLPFLQADLTKELPIKSEFGYCTDVLEHIPPEDVEAVIKNITNASKKVFFQISTVPDAMGALINQTLHLTVENHKWWKEKFLSLGVDINFEQEFEEASVFVVTKNQ